jgi:ABC-2 type transport system permease protein
MREVGELLNNLFLKSCRDQIKTLLWWGIGIASLVVITMLFYPSMRDSAENYSQLVDSMPEPLVTAFIGEFTDFGSPEGFLGSQLFFLMVPLIYILFSIISASGTIAGEERRGILEMLLSYPVDRRSVVVHKFLALVVAGFVFGVCIWSSVLLGILLVSMEISLLRVTETVASAFLFGTAFSAFTLFLSAATGNRGFSVGIASAVAFASYIIYTMGPQVDLLEPFSRVSPFHFYIGSNPLVNGLDMAHSGTLVGIAAVFLYLAIFTFERRDIK